MTDCTTHSCACRPANVPETEEFSTLDFALSVIMTTWRSSSSRVCALVTDADATQQQFCSLIQELNDFTYPLNGLTASVSISQLVNSGLRT